MVQPPDLLIVEVLEALPGRPITGEHLVRPDGTMTLGFYGDLEVAGLTLPEIKEKVVDHLKKYLSEDTLGLWAPAPDGREGRIRVAPQDSGTVYVDVCAYNSAYYYVVGQVASAGRFPITGNETVLDAINLAGGLLGGAGPREVRLIRRGRGHNPDEVMPIDYQEISQGTDPSTNYQVMPGDRLVVTAAPSAKAKDADRPQPDAETSHPIMPGVRSVVTADPKVKSKDADRSPADADTRETRRLEQRLDRVEGKLDQILETLRRVVGDR